MAKKQGSDDAGHTRPRRYYDPAATPGTPTILPFATAPIGPTNNSRPHRRRREAMSFVEQWKLAKRMGFPVPESAKQAVLMEHQWIARWEEAYAKQ